MEQPNRLAQQAEETRQLRENLGQVKHILMVMSGKGGVGKTTVSVNLALGLARSGMKTGILDIDIHGPNVPKMLGIENEQLFTGDENRIEPIEGIPGLKVVSLALAGYEPERPIIWRGPIKMNVIKQFLKDVAWGELDYLIIDTPPGDRRRTPLYLSALAGHGRHGDRNHPPGGGQPRRDEERLFRPGAEDSDPRNHREYERFRLPRVRHHDPDLRQRRRQKRGRPL